MEKSYDYKYKGEIYKIRFKLLIGKIKIFYNNNLYSSNYSLQDIIDKIKKEVNKIGKYEKISSLTEKRKKLESFDIISCLEKNILQKILVFGASYGNYLPSIWNIFPGDDKNKEDTFQINLYKQSNIYKLLIIRFNENLINEIIINDNNTQNNDKIQEEIDKIPNKFKISININDINELNQNNNQQYVTNDNYKKVFILRDINELNQDLIKLIRKKYREQLFIIIPKQDKIINKIEQKLGDILSNKDIRKYFDLKNIIQLENMDKLSLSIIKIYLYFNQIDDYDLIDFVHENKLLNKEIKGLKEEIEQIINNDHVINIKVCGTSSTGKSTFINTILDEKRALTNPSSGTTKKCNIYISKKYNLKFIDDLGLDEGNEGEVNNEIESLKDKIHRIYIDENIKLSFGYNNDLRNNLHLLLFFFKYDCPYNITMQQLLFVNKIKEKKIPIIFIINCCEDIIFKD